MSAPESSFTLIAEDLLDVYGTLQEFTVAEEGGALYTMRELMLAREVVRLRSEVSRMRSALRPVDDGYVRLEGLG